MRYPVVLVLLMGCATGPTYTVDPTFTPGEQEAIQIAINAWPQEAYGRHHVQFVRVATLPGIALGSTRGDVVRMLPCSDDLDYCRKIAMHELGHVFKMHHISARPSVMTPTVEAMVDWPTEFDEMVAVSNAR